MSSFRLSEDSIFSIVEPASTRAETIDIGGTNNNSAYVAMKSFMRCVLQVELGTWDEAGDDLDECRIEQAVDSAGTSVKDLTSDASGGNYDTDNPIDADGDFVIIEVRGEDMDMDAATPFDFVRAYVAEGGNTAQDDCFAQLIRYGASYPQKEQQGAASAANVYVDTGT